MPAADSDQARFGPKNSMVARGSVTFRPNAVSQLLHSTAVRKGNQAPYPPIPWLSMNRGFEGGWCIPHEVADHVQNPRVHGRLVLA